jgi:HEAT repeat protein
MDHLARALAIRPGEGRSVALVAGAFAAVEAGRGLGELGIATLVVDRIGSDILPVLYIGLGLVGLVVTLAYGAALGRSRSARVFPWTLVLMAAVLALEWVAIVAGPPAVLALAWVSIFAVGMLLLTLIWTVGGLAFDARQAKRLFPLLVSAAIVGSLAGYLSAIVLQRLIGVETLILGEAVLLTVAALLLRALGDRARPRRTTEDGQPGLLSALTAGASYVAGSPLMRLVAVAYVLLAILLFSLEFPFFTAMESAYPDASQLLTVLALLTSAVTLTAFLVGTLVANRLYARFGVATVALVLPLVYLAGFGVWIVSFTAASAILVRYTQQVTQRGLTNAAFGAFYSILPASRRGQVLAFMDGVPGQLGTMISGVLLVVAASLALQQVFVVGLVAAAACLVVGLGIRRAYARSLVQTLREGRAEQFLAGGPGLAALSGDREVIVGLRQATRAGAASERLLAADLLRRLGATAAADDLRRLAADGDADVRRVALVGLAAMEGAAALDVLKAALEDPAPDVRAAAVSGLASLGLVQEARPVVIGMLRDGSPAERIAAFGALGSLPSDHDDELEPWLRAGLRDPVASVRAAALRASVARALVSTDALVLALDDDALEVRRMAATLLRERPEAVPAVIDLVRHGADPAREAALRALDGNAATVRTELLAWADGQVRRAGRLRGHALALGAIGGSATAPYLEHVLRRRLAAIQARLLQCLAILGAPEASSLIRRCLHAPDPDVRAQAVEAIEALGDPKLARGIVRLLEQDVEMATAGHLEAIAAADALSRDDDVWVRALALRTLAEHHAAAGRLVVRQVREDPSPIVHAAVEVPEGGGEVPDELRLVNEVDRMLALRRVPIFASLDPEDLQRVAATASEHSWDEGDVLMTEGDIGNDLVVIVEGAVSVVHEDGTDRHVLRRVEAGEHIGELAVLREGPRAATVVAEPPGVRGLVISGEAVGALLRERPDAAMAMLATLAERISQQR